MSTCGIVNTPPTVADYLRLRVESGLSPRTTAQGQAAISGTWAFRRALSSDGETVAPERRRTCGVQQVTATPRDVRYGRAKRARTFDTRH